MLFLESCFYVKITEPFAPKLQSALFSGDKRAPALILAITPLLDPELNIKQ